MVCIHACSCKHVLCMLKHAATLHYMHAVTPVERRGNNRQLVHEATCTHDWLVVNHLEAVYEEMCTRIVYQETCLAAIANLRGTAPGLISPCQVITEDMGFCACARVCVYISRPDDGGRYEWVNACRPLKSKVFQPVTVGSLLRRSQTWIKRPEKRV